MRVVVDTNLWISFLIGKKVAVMRSALELDEVELVITEKLVAEIERVVLRPKLSKYIQAERAAELVAWLKQHACNVELTNIPSRCRDPKDDYLLELAVQSNAVYLVSGDDDLLSLGTIADCRILTFRQFVDEVVNS